MLSRSLACACVAMVALFVVSGCGTSQKKAASEVTGIKTRVETLESRIEGVESKQAEAERMTAEQAQALDELKSSKASRVDTNISVKPREGSRSGRTKDIQQALKIAGFYTGKVDGVKGKSTKKAIKEFQKANGLKTDGVVGHRTWELLSNYLSSANMNANPSAAASVSASGNEGVK